MPQMPHPACPISIGSWSLTRPILPLQAMPNWLALAWTLRTPQSFTLHAESWPGATRRKFREARTIRCSCKPPTSFCVTSSSASSHVPPAWPSLGASRLSKPASPFAGSEGLCPRFAFETWLFSVRQTLHIRTSMSHPFEYSISKWFLTRGNCSCTIPFCARRQPSRCLAAHAKTAKT